MLTTMIMMMMIAIAITTTKIYNDYHDNDNNKQLIYPGYII